MERTPVFTVGHANHAPDAFAGLLTRHGVTAVADVRSVPFSRLHPQFSRERLARDLRGRGISYVFLGRELGARPADPDGYVDGRVSYPRLAATPRFREGIRRVLEGSARHRIALLCAERDPVTCHRTVLVARALEEEAIPVAHILADGSLELHASAMLRLAGSLGLPVGDLFVSEADRVAEAYRLQGERIAYVRPEVGTPEEATT